MPEEFRATRIQGGTEIAEQVLAWAGTELVRRQQNPLDGDEGRRERWEELLVIYIEDFENLSQRSKDQVQRLGAQGRREGILLSVRTGPPRELPEVSWVHKNPADRFNPPLEPLTLDEATALAEAALIEMDQRVSTRKGRK